MKDGILILNKSQGWTSSDCVAICKRAFRVSGVKKVGHGGTLDPMATGLLPIFVGQAARIMEYLDLDYKTYICTAKLGITSDTQDIWGELKEVMPLGDLRKSGIITRESIKSNLADFAGNIEQIPPKYSAVRINGKRLYEYAYNGEKIDVEIKPRKVHIKEIELLFADMKKLEFSFRVTCSKGTYIRTICNDLGDKLGCGCVMSALERVKVGNIELSDDVICVEEIKRLTTGAGQDKDLQNHVAEMLEALLLPADYPLEHFGSASLSADRAMYFSRGNAIRLNQVSIEKEPDIPGNYLTGEVPCNARGRRYDLIYKIYERDTRQFLGTGFLDNRNKEMKADKVFVPKR
ncbi:MAG: tRNA pseudouridine(55) synthase TruB [Lentihominibacter sp.]|jgi:tRNA pseudouridine55 synthase